MEESIENGLENRNHYIPPNAGEGDFPYIPPNAGEGDFPYIPPNAGEGDFPFLAYMKEALRLQEVDPCSYSPLVLAYIGDAVYELMIRTKVINRGSMQVNKMHKASAGLVKAEAQANLIKALEPDLTAEELAVFKRGRNAKSVTTARHATVIDYRMATGFEALVGYLYLTERFERMIELVSLGLDRMGELEWVTEDRRGTSGESMMRRTWEMKTGG